MGLFDIDAHETITVRTFDVSGDLLNTYAESSLGNNTIQSMDINSGLI